MRWWLKLYTIKNGRGMSAPTFRPMRCTAELLTFHRLPEKRKRMAWRQYFYAIWRYSRRVSHNYIETNPLTREIFPII